MASRSLDANERDTLIAGLEALGLQLQAVTLTGVDLVDQQLEKAREQAAFLVEELRSAERVSVFHGEPARKPRKKPENEPAAG